MAARSGRQYPRTFGEFLNWFPDDPACALYLAELRWPEGFSCPRCGASTGEPTKAWSTSRGTYVCARCKKETSLITGTIFEGTRVRLVTWFRAAWLVCSSKSGVSAKHLQRELGISYPTAWLMLHKLRLAMKRPGRDADRLRGEIEVDESYLGGPTPGGKRGRGAEGKLIVAIAVERMEPTDDEQRLLVGKAEFALLDHRASLEQHLLSALLHRGAPSRCPLTTRLRLRPSTRAALTTAREDEGLVVELAHYDGVREQPIEEQAASTGLAACASAVEAEDELVEVRLGVLGGPAAMMGAEKPALEQGCDAVDAG